MSPKKFAVAKCFSNDLIFFGFVWLCIDKKTIQTKEIPLAVLRFPLCLITSYQCCLISSISRYYRSGGLNVVGLCVSRTILKAVTLDSGELTFMAYLFARLQHYKVQCLPFFIVINLPKASLRWSSTLLSSAILSVLRFLFIFIFCIINQLFI